MTSAPRQYASAGVDLAGAERAKARISEAVARTRTSHSVGAVGAFGGMVRVPTGFRSPVLVMSTDGVGTKVLVAMQAGRFDTVGEDLVNHSVNDILVHGATPLAFMDYIAGAELGEGVIADIVEGVARGCERHGMALAGGETAQMPGLYAAGHFDVAGTIVGVVEQEAALHGDKVVPGDVLLGYASTGLHTNGYSLARAILFDKLGLRLDDQLPGTGASVADALLAVHRSYVDAVAPVLEDLHGLAHITGGGIPGNLIRILPPRCGARIDASAWPSSALFVTLQRGGDVTDNEMRDVFNLGLGMIAALPASAAASAQSAAAQAGVETWVVGTVLEGRHEVQFG